jgi:hypothetical protein
VGTGFARGTCALPFVGRVARSAGWGAESQSSLRMREARGCYRRASDETLTQSLDPFLTVPITEKEHRRDSVPLLLTMHKPEPYPGQRACAASGTIVSRSSLLRSSSANSDLVVINALIAHIDRIHQALDDRFRDLVVVIDQTGHLEPAVLKRDEEGSCELSLASSMLE